MTISWWFKRAGPGDRARESQVEKFFNSDAVANRANAIVREGIQNSLDAGVGDQTVLVRIAIGTWSASETAERLPKYTKGFFDHLQVEGVRTKLPGAPESGEEFRYLIFEDFGTTGLKGDPSQWWPDEHGAANPFFNYFRGEGISDKTEGARGRHGVGRLVFMFASRGRTILAVTCRQDKNRQADELLMGTSVLRNHWLKGKPYLPDGWFGVQDASEHQLILPVRSPNPLIEEFKKDFELSRKDQHGLSVVVPWLNPDVTEIEVIRAVLAGYFHPILRGKLIVEVRSEDASIEWIDAASIEHVASSQPSDIAAQLKPIVALAKASLRANDPLVLAPPPGPHAPKWHADNVSEEVQQAVQKNLDAGELVALRVPLQVRPKGKAAVDCHFDIYLQRDATVSDGQIHFIREGITITDVRPRRTSGVRALVVIDEGALATFLGDAENPSHTEWQKELVREKYTYAPAHIDYVVQSVPSVLGVISQKQKKPDTSLLIDLFALPAAIDTGLKAKTKKERKNTVEQTVDYRIDLPKVPRPYTIAKLTDGFVVRRGDPDAKRPEMLAIRVAYGVRRGSPFAKYSPADFRLGKGGITGAVKGCGFADMKDNFMLVRINEDDFEVAVRGFDTSHRDLHVDVKVRGSILPMSQNSIDEGATDAAAT